MRDRKLLFHNDARHYYIYNYDPPFRLEDAWKPVDEIIGTGVDTLVYGLGAGPTMFHSTEVGEIWGSHIDSFPEVSAWRAYENIKSLQSLGLDPLKVLIDRSREKGVEFFVSLRQSHPADPSVKDDVFNWQFRIDNPEMCLKGRGAHAFDWNYEEVRNERFALIEETVNKYDVDGIELDWVFWPHFFEDEEASLKSDILTEYMVQVANVVAKASTKKGKKIELGVRVLPTNEGNLAAGMDVETWIKQGCLDFIIPTIYQDQQIDADLPFEWLVNLTKGLETKVYPSLHNQRKIQTSIGTNSEVRASIDHYRAAAASYWSKGADGIYLPWFTWPHGAEELNILNLIGDYSLISGSSKHYVVKKKDELSESYKYCSQIPAEINVGENAQITDVDFYIADKLDVDHRSTLRLLISDTTIHDGLKVSLNGKDLTVKNAWRTTVGFTHVSLEFSDLMGVFKEGINRLGIVINSRPTNLIGANLPRLENVEVLVKYPEPLGSL